MHSLWIAMFFLTLFSYVDYTTGQSCNNNQFWCSDGKCIDINKKCDGSFDCSDNSDELSCEKDKTCPEGLLLCPSNRCMVECPTTTQQPDTTTTAYTTTLSKQSFQRMSQTSITSRKQTTITWTSTDRLPDRTSSDSQDDPGPDAGVIVVIIAAVLILFLISGTIWYRKYKKTETRRT